MVREVLEELKDVNTSSVIKYHDVVRIFEDK